MKLHKLFKEYIWIINIVYQSKGITLADLNEEWVKTEMSGGLEFTRLTFYRHRKGIDENFRISIECDRRTMKYYIANEKVMRENSLQNWMLNTLSVNNIISNSSSLDSRILLESIAGSNDILETIVKAMEKSKKIEVVYHRYGYADSTKFVAEPYCIKLWNKRWYTVFHRYRPATDEKPEREYLGVYSIDRIEQVNILQESFVMKNDFDAKGFFSECFGVITGDGSQVEEVFLRAFGQQVYYLRGLPMHHSQEEFETEDGYSDFRLIIRPTQDFINNLLSCGSSVKVLQPKWLADKIKEEMIRAAKMYE